MLVQVFVVQTVRPLLHSHPPPRGSQPHASSNRQSCPLSQPTHDQEKCQAVLVPCPTAFSLASAVARHVQGPMLWQRWRPPAPTPVLLMLTRTCRTAAHIKGLALPPSRSTSSAGSRAADTPPAQASLPLLCIRTRMQIGHHGHGRLQRALMKAWQIMTHWWPRTRCAPGGLAQAQAAVLVSHCVEFQVLSS